MRPDFIMKVHWQHWFSWQLRPSYNCCRNALDVLGILAARLVRCLHQMSISNNRLTAHDGTSWRIHHEMKDGCDCGNWREGCDRLCHALAIYIYSTCLISITCREEAALSKEKAERSSETFFRMALKSQFSTLAHKFGYIFQLRVTALTWMAF